MSDSFPDCGKKTGIDVVECMHFRNLGLATGHALQSYEATQPSSLVDVCRFLADRGITITEADAAYEYTGNWLSDHVSAGSNGPLYDKVTTALCDRAIFHSPSTVISNLYIILDTFCTSPTKLCICSTIRSLFSLPLSFDCSSLQSTS